MTTFYRGSSVNADKDYPGSVKLNKDLITKIDFSKVIYGERSQAGAMGNSGGIILYVIDHNKITKYETNTLKDQETAIEALKQITLNEGLFNLYYGGMGNGVFVRKGAELEIDEDENCFWYQEGKSRYKIQPSVKGVFLAVSDQLNGGKPKGLDAMHKAWEQGLRNKFLTEEEEK